eukprot:3295862-Amphidinium_carterae.1
MVPVDFFDRLATTLSAKASVSSLAATDLPKEESKGSAANASAHCMAANLRLCPNFAAHSPSCRTLEALRRRGP